MLCYQYFISTIIATLSLCALASTISVVVFILYYIHHYSTLLQDFLLIINCVYFLAIAVSSSIYCYGYHNQYVSTINHILYLLIVLLLYSLLILIHILYVIEYIPVIILLFIINNIYTYILCFCIVLFIFINKNDVPTSIMHN